ncbi:hypothetical protein SAMD00019534_085310 [Acytostelium subglobosum LB1]|uniref:hypothetical protein n=1 Tax=Acytostelium subglobosum LB1 TaxID=1410327 RepID=UPI0006450D7C|nr:hypothetical protein SAMD00019534_085310 [Acytostelium subglobosum LB1]GAM25356.1 hypothetical protein SAMD00019534_085310 [Acytostelium subglobosum LB1]|eukprot:XP_012751876.1 hypothetical protein SAMD00019534_085310 [Acytostelium subglobosum LB1]
MVVNGDINNNGHYNNNKVNDNQRVNDGDDDDGENEEDDEDNVTTVSLGSDSQQLDTDLDYDNDDNNINDKQNNVDGHVVDDAVNDIDNLVEDHDDVYYEDDVDVPHQQLLQLQQQTSNNKCGTYAIVLILSVFVAFIVGMVLTTPSSTQETLIKQVWSLPPTIQITTFNQALVDKHNRYQTTLFRDDNAPLNIGIGTEQLIQQFQSHYAPLRRRAASKPLSIHLSAPANSKNDIDQLLNQFYHDLFKVDSNECLVRPAPLDKSDLQAINRMVTDVNKKCKRAMFIIEAGNAADMGQLDAIFDGALSAPSTRPNDFSRVSLPANHTFIVVSSIGQQQLTEYIDQQLPVSTVKSEGISSNHLVSLEKILIDETKKHWEHRLCTRTTKMIPFVIRTTKEEERLG